MKPNFHKVEDGCVLVEVDLGVYGIGPLLRAAYEMTDRCYIHLQSQSEQCVEVRFRSKDGSGDEAADLAGVGRLILQANRDAQMLADWLPGWGWALVEDREVEDGGRPYRVLVAEPV